MRFQSIYNSVRITRERPEGGQQELEIAVNKEGEGLFTRLATGDWRQWRGCGQFHATSPADLVRRFRREEDDSSIRMVRGSAIGWEVAR